MSEARVYLYLHQGASLVLLRCSVTRSRVLLTTLQCIKVIASVLGHPMGVLLPTAVPSTLGHPHGGTAPHTSAMQQCLIPPGVVPLLSPHTLSTPSSMHAGCSSVVPLMLAAPVPQLARVPGGQAGGSARIPSLLAPSVGLVSPCSRSSVTFTGRRRPQASEGGINHESDSRRPGDIFSP